MKNFLSFIFTFLLFVNYSFAEVAIQDPDLNLSIEELRRKYPIGWLEKKYGSYENCDEADGGFFYKGLNKNPPANLICSFEKDGSLSKKIKFKDLSIKEIKSVFCYDSSDPRASEVVVMVLKHLDEKRSFFTKKEEEVYRFIKSEKIAKSFKEDDEFFY